MSVAAPAVRNLFIAVNDSPTRRAIIDCADRAASLSSEAGTMRRLGVWRSLVARSVRVGEAPSSNLGTPMAIGRAACGGPHVPHRLPRLPGSSRGRAPRGCLRRRLHARPPGPGPRARGLPRARPAARARPRPGALREARAAAIAEVDGIPSSTTTRRSGSSSPSGSSAAWAARRYLRRGRRDGAPLDALGALRALRRRAAGARRSRARGLWIGLLSNSSRNLDEFVAHHRLDVDAALTSHVHGKTKPHGTIFLAMLDRLGVRRRRRRWSGTRSRTTSKAHVR